MLGKRIIRTRLHHDVTIREEHAIAALEAMSRFAVDPKWLIYLPPTMSPSETTREPGLLEHPAEAFAYYCHQGVPRVVCQTKHMGSRAVVIVCRDEEAGIRWWEELTAGGGEGMVVKPFDFMARGKRGIVQPAVKCRGREYLRIIYGPEYTAPENLERLRSRGLAAKRSLALREFALGIEALERFVRREPLYRVHECVFGVLALESEPVDPRL